MHLPKIKEGAEAVEIKVAQTLPGTPSSSSSEDSGQERASHDMRLRFPVANPSPGALGSPRSQVLGQLRTLRTHLEQARYALMHFKADRLDRDRLEPAARRVDMLMDMFASNSRDPVQGTLWVSGIQNGIDQVTNPKAAQALGAARAVIAAMLNAIAADRKVP
jgi:hypothetical protein